MRGPLWAIALMLYIIAMAQMGQCGQSSILRDIRWELSAIKDRLR